jgi:hypothetical protein
MAAARTTRLLLAAILAGVTACSNENNPQTPTRPAPAPGIMSATVDGNAWSAGGVSGSPAAAAYNPGSILIVGHRILANGSGSNVTLHVEAFTGVGTYTLRTGALSGARAIFAFYTTALDTTKYATDSAHTGTLAVTLFDTVNRDIKGTFSFSGYDAAGAVVSNVTSGVFDVSF